MPRDTRLSETGKRRIDGLKFKSLSNRPIAKTINRPVNVNYFCVKPPSNMTIIKKR